jgi:cytochrome c oxidase cbb3-type subunit 3
MKAMRHWFRIVTIGVSCGLLAGLAAEPDPAAVKRGKDAFVATCGFCHGNDGTGSRAPDLVRSPLLSHDTNGDKIGPVIRSGMPDDGMPAFPLNDALIKDIAAFLHAQALAALHSAKLPGDYPVAKLLTGNAEAGKAYFNGPGGCNKCHSVTGDLKGIAKQYSAIALQSLILYPTGEKMTATVTLPSGQKVEGTVIAHDEFTIALRNAEGWYRSYDLKHAKVELHDPLEQHRVLLHQYTDKDVHNLFAYLETLQ